MTDIQQSHTYQWLLQQIAGSHVFEERLTPRDTPLPPLLSFTAPNTPAAIAERWALTQAGEASYRMVADQHSIEQAQLFRRNSVTMPNIMVGTVGGGTTLPSQQACLEMMGLAGAGHARALAEICAATCLAGELSLIGALCADEFARAHVVLARRTKTLRCTQPVLEGYE